MVPRDKLAALVAQGSANADIHVFDILLDSLGNVSLGPGLNLTAAGQLAGEACCGTWTQNGDELVVTGGSSSVDLWVISATVPGAATKLTDTPVFFEVRPPGRRDFTKLAFEGPEGIYTVDVTQAGWNLGEPALLLSKPLRGSVGFPSWRPVQ